MFKRHLNAIAGVLAGLLLFFSSNLHAQDKTPCDYSIPGEVLNWNFGDKAQLTFSEETLFPVSTAMPGGIDIPKGVSSISDAEGNLLFFTDGMRIWGSGYFELTNGTGLQGNLLANQSAIFIPSPGNPDKYFLFTADLYIPPVYTNGIRYHVIERINYSWTVTEKNILLMEQNAQKLTAVKHANGEDYWLVSHGFGTEKGGSYFAFSVMEDSISEVPVESTLGVPHEGDFNNNGGYIKISPDGSKIALAVPAAGFIEVADFNTETGEVTNPLSSTVGQYNFPLGVEFSPDNNFLYFTTNPLDGSLNYLYQIDLNQADLNNPTQIESFAQSDNRQLGALQLAVDGRIYVGSFGQALAPYDYLGVIYNPNRAGTACNFNFLEGNQIEGLALNQSGSKEGLPNFVSSYFDIPSFWWQNHCATHITTFRLQNEANNGDVSWDFGIDGATDNDLRGEYTYEEAGTYPVTVTEEFEGESYTHTREITIYPLPSIDIGAGEEVIYILPNSSITLDAGAFDYYYWEDEDGNLLGEGQYLDVDQEGIYAVTVTDTNCCENRDEVEIKFANISLPNAFRPGSAIAENTTFKALGAVSALNNFSLIIYNRWGQLVFESDDPLQGWDGTIKGEAAPGAVYVWQMTYESSESQYQASQEVVQRGVVTLIR
jgi:gliding motility-associated-like protein